MTEFRRCPACGLTKCRACFAGTRSRCKACDNLIRKRRHLRRAVLTYLGVPDPLHALLRRELLREAQARGGVEEVWSVLGER